MIIIMKMPMYFPGKSFGLLMGTRCLELGTAGVLLNIQLCRNRRRNIHKLLAISNQQLTLNSFSKDSRIFGSPVRLSASMVMFSQWLVIASFFLHEGLDMENEMVVKAVARMMTRRLRRRISCSRSESLVSEPASSGYYFN